MKAIYGEINHSEEEVGYIEKASESDDESNEDTLGL